MADLTLKKIEEITPYAGPNAIPGMRFRPAARALGVTAWGMNVFEIDPGCEKYPEHDHLEDGQENVARSASSPRSAANCSTTSSF